MGNKILIIGNEAAFTNALLAKLSADEFIVSCLSGSSNINETILFIKLNKPDYIIQALDLRPSEGLYLLEKIKSDDIITKIPVFVIFEKKNKEIRAKCDILGVNYYLSRNSYSLDELISKIEKIISNNKKIK